MELKLHSEQSGLSASQPTPCFTLPLVSIIVLNFNYGRFLREAVDSVLDQTYSNIECLIVDDASTDESDAVLRELESSNAPVKIIRRKENGGQSLAVRDGFEASSGKYVVFLDADDYLMPTFVETHVLTHLSLRVPVGFSSSDMALVKDAEILLSTTQSFSNFVRSGAGKKADLLRPFDQNMPDCWPFAADPHLADKVHFVPPNVVEPWVWSPTSGNCFRRDALAFILDNTNLGKLRYCTDAYMIRGVSVLTGSVLIDRSLSVYRLHQTNAFLARPFLNGLLHFESGGANDYRIPCRQMLIDHFIAKAEFLAPKMGGTYFFFQTLLASDVRWQSSTPQVDGCRSYLSARLVEDYANFERIFGARELNHWMVKAGVTKRKLLSVRFTHWRKAKRSVRARLFRPRATTKPPA